MHHDLITLNKLIAFEESGRVTIGLDRSSATTIMAKQDRSVGAMVLTVLILIVVSVIIGFTKGINFGCVAIVIAILSAPLAQKFAAAKMRALAYRDVRFFDMWYEMGLIIVKDKAQNKRYTYPEDWSEIE
ncbi:MAG: hypothetical protein KF824_00845 [Fimbriimonadaceae bacterium]|nr:MAG: hypothetical protein KF824_00845 [Fimbriimonadaceae bacterium]